MSVFKLFYWCAVYSHSYTGHCNPRPRCPFPEAFVGKDCRCWCPTEEMDREPVQICPEVKTSPPAHHETTTPETVQTTPPSNGIVLGITFKPSGGSSPSEGGTAVLTPVGLAHTYIPNTSSQGARMVPSTAEQGSHSLAATLSNLPNTVKVATLRGSEKSSPTSDRRNTIQRVRDKMSRGSTAASRGLTISNKANGHHRPQNDRSRGALSNAARSRDMHGVNDISKRPRFSSATNRNMRPQIPGLAAPSNDNLNSLLDNVIALLSTNHRRLHNRMSNGPIVSSRAPGGGIITADLRTLLRQLHRLNRESQMSPVLLDNARGINTNGNSNSRNMDLLSQDNVQNILQAISAILSPHTAQQQNQPLRPEEIGQILRYLPTSSVNPGGVNSNFGEPVSLQQSSLRVVRPTNGQDNYVRHLGLLSHATHNSRRRFS